MFLNLRNKKLTVNSYRLVNACVTTVEDILDCANTMQTLSAAISTEQDWQELKFLTNR